MRPEHNHLAAEKVARPVSMVGFILFFMAAPSFEPHEGGVKIVFDVPEHVVGEAVRKVSAVAFSVERYYRPERAHLPGAPEAGWVRLGAERPMREFTDVEQELIVAAFDAVSLASPFTCRRMGTEVWTAGGGGGSAGDREPRSPLPKNDGNPATVDETSDR
jgi:hypothetical protein